MANVICPTISVKNMEESIRFYTNILHLKEKGRIGGAHGVNIVFLEDEEHNLLELVEHAQGDVPAGHGNVSILLGIANLQATLEELRANDIPITRGPIETPGGQKFVFIQDSNGVVLELMEGFQI